MSDPRDYRIGDTERDDAVRLLTDHHSAGRLSVDEFNDRMTRALEGRTMADLHALFADLPGPRPGELLPLPPQPEPLPAYDDTPDEVLPWYAQWYMILVAVGATIVFDDIWFVIPLMAIWLWVIYPSIHQKRHLQQVVRARRPLTLEEQQRVMAEVRIGRKISAIKMYRELTGAGLVEAKETIEDWERRQIGF